MCSLKRFPHKFSTERYDASGSLIDNRSDIRLLFTNRSNYPTRTDSYQLVLASENNRVLERPFKWLLGKLYRMLKRNLLKKTRVLMRNCHIIHLYETRCSIFYKLVHISVASVWDYSSLGQKLHTCISVSSVVKFLLQWVKIC